MDDAFSTTGSPALVTDDLATPGSILGQMATSGIVRPDPVGTASLPETPAPRAWDGRVNYAPGSEDPTAVRFGGMPRDPFVIDLDPTGEKTVKFLRDRGEEGTTQTILSAQLIGGLVKSREWLMERPEGQRLLAIMGRDRAGKKRDLWEAISDFGPSDLPFMSLVGTQAGSISAAVRTADTFKKLQGGEQVTDEEALSATLALAEARRQQDGTFGSTVGDIVRAAPGFMFEFLATGGLGSAVRTGAVKAGANGIHVGLARNAKILARDLVEADAKRIGAKTVKEMSEKGVLDGVAESVFRNTMQGNPLYAGMADDALRAMAFKRAEYEAGKYVSRTAGDAVSNGFNSFLQWGQNHISRGLLDFGAWGTEEATVAYSTHTTAGRALSDALGAFLVEAPLKGVAMWAPNQYVAKPLIEKATGNDRSVSRNQLALMQQALFSGNEAMMADAESISLGQDLLEYVSENAGRGFGALLRGAGLLVDKAGAKAIGKGYVPLLTPASQVIRAEGTPLVAENAGVSVGGKIREWVQKMLGTREEFNRRISEGKANAVIKALGITAEADKAAVRTAVLNNSTAGLRRDLAARVGPEMDKFAMTSAKSAFSEARKTYEANIASGMAKAAAQSEYDAAVKGLSYKSFARFAVADYMARHGINPTGLMNLYSRMGYDGILGEMFEERYSDVAKGLFNLDERQDGERWWNLDFKQAVKNMYPGFDQLAAEAIGFAVPMVTRGIAMRMAAKVGGDGVVTETKNMLSAFRDVTRTDEIFQMSKGSYIAAMDRVMEMSARAVEDARAEVTKAEAADADEEQLAGLRENLSQLETVDRLRRERHAKLLQVEDIAKANADDLISITGVSDQRLLGPEGSRIPVYSSQETEQSAAGRNAMVGYAPTLARNLFEFQSSFEGEGQPWYRWFAQKAIGFTAGLATGDFSAMSGNAVEWHARDYGLSPHLCWQLKEGYAREFERQRKILDEEGKRMAARGAEGTYAVRREDIMRATDAAFEGKARGIMSSFLEASNFRTFTQSRFRDQATLQFARENGYEYVTRNAKGEEQAPVFYKVNRDGSFDEASVLTVDQMEQSARTENADGTVTDRIAQIADDIAVATVNVMTRHLTRGEYAKSALLRLARLPQNFDGVSLATVESALALCGQDRLASVISVDGKTPLKDLVPGGGVAKVNMDVVSFIASKDKVGDVDPRALESVAQSMGMRFDGSEEGLKARNAEVFRLAKLANAVKNENTVYFAGSTAKVEDWDTRVNSGNAFLVKAERQADGTYAVVSGVDPEHPTERIAPGNSATFASYDTLVAAMEGLGYVPASARIVFTQAREFEFADMYTALRELNLVPEYEKACRDAGATPHPMLRKYAGTNKYVYPEDRVPQGQPVQAETRVPDDTPTAGEVLERSLNLAARWNPDLREVVGPVPKDSSAEEIEKAYKELWDPVKGYMAIGERILRSRGVRSDNPAAKYAGEFRPYTRPRYSMLVSSARLSGDLSADVYVPVDANAGFSYTTALFDAHLQDAFQKRPQFVKDAMGSIVSPFVEDVWRATEVYLRDPEVQKDKPLVDQIKRFRQAYLKQTDRAVKAVVDDPKTGAKQMKWKTVRGRELTPSSFAVLASQFAMFRAGEHDLTGDFSRVTALIAPLVYRSNSFIPFMNVVDIALGGNGFLGEMIASGNKRDEVLGTQRGIRGLMAAATGDPSAFRKAFTEKALPKGVDYNSFLDKLVESARTLPQAGVESMPNRDGRAASEAVKAAKASVDAEALNRALSDKERAHQEALAAKEAELAGIVAANEELTRKVTDRTAKVAELQAKVATLTEENTELRRQAAEFVAREETVPQDLKDAIVNSDSTRTAAVRSLDEAKNELRETTQATVEGGNAGRIPPAVATEAAEALGDEVRPDAVDMADNDDFFGTVDAGPDSALPLVFDERVDGNRLDIRFGTEQKLGYELTKAQAQLAVNQAVRAALAAGQAADEGTVVDYAKRIFRGFSESDLDAVREQYRNLSDQYSREGRDITSIRNVPTGDLWAEEDREDDAVSEDSFNEKSVAEFESRELGDFLALAWKASPETGRNFQALVSNIREFNRWQLQFTAEHESEYSQGARDAVKFLNDFLNPRGNSLGKTMPERLALFERQLRLFDENPALVQTHLRNLLHGGRKGRALSRKGAMLLSYMLSLPANDRNRFAVLVSNSLVTSAVHLDPSDSVPEDEKRMVPRTRGVSKTSEGVVVDSFSDLIGKSRAAVKDLAGDIRSAVKAELASKDANRFLAFDDKDANVINVIRRNGMEIALRMAEVFGPESPLFSALTSPRALNYMAAVMGNPRSSKADKGVLRTLAESMSYRQYAKGKSGPEIMARRTGIELVDTICSTLDMIAETGDGPVTREEVSSWFVTAFTTGDPRMSGLFESSPMSSRITSPLMTLMSMFDSSLPETVVRADFDPWHADRQSSVAVASRGMIPLANRFMDREFERLCRGLFSEAQVRIWNPGKTYDQVLAECRSDMTWPDRYRTPIFAKSLSKGVSARQALAACENTFNDPDATRFFVPIYAGDHSSAVLLQVPVQGSDGKDMRRLLKSDATKEEDEKRVVRDVFGREIPSTEYTRKADYLCRLLGLDLLGTDAKRSAVSSLECEGASMCGVKSVDADGSPQFGTNRIYVGISLDDGFTNEEMKGGILVHGYGAEQLRSMAKDPNSKDLKAHFIGTGGNWITFIKALSSMSSKGERYAKGTALRAMQDWLESQVKDRWSTGTFTDEDSYKVGVLNNAEVLDSGKTILQTIKEKVKELHRQDPDMKFEWDSAKVDEMVGTVTAGGVETKLSELVPGIAVHDLDVLSTPSVAISVEDNSVIGYTVANVSHESRVPDTPGRTPRNQTIDAFTWAASLQRATGLGLDPKVAQRAIDLVADWGVVASAAVTDERFMEAMRLSSSGISELLRYGEHPNGQNVKAELVRVVNAQLRNLLNIPVNAIDAALDSCCASRDKKTGEIHDHAKDPAYRAMNRGSKWFAGNEAAFWGVTRQVPLWNCNVRANWFRNTWFVDEDALAKADNWLRGKSDTGAADENRTDYWAMAEKKASDEGVTGRDEKIVLLFEAIFTDLHEREKEGPAAPRVAEIRDMLSTLFVDQYGKVLRERKWTDGRNCGTTFARTVSYDDLFHGYTGTERFDRSAFRINSRYGNDRIPLSSDTEGKYPGGRIALGGTMIGLPRTPSYNALLVTGRAGLFCTETDPAEGVDGGTVQGPSAAVMPDPQTIDTEGVDFDGDKTKLYFLKPEAGRVMYAKDQILGLLPHELSEEFALNRDTGNEETSFVRSKVRAAIEPLTERMFVNDDGRVERIDPLSTRTYDTEFRAISEQTRMRVANDFARVQFDMALALPSQDGNGNERVRPDARVDAIGSAAFHETGPSSSVGKDGMEVIKSNPRIPQAILKVKGPDGKPVNRIGKVRVATVVSDGANNAQDSRANVVAVMKDLHFGYSTGMFFGEGNVFNCDPSEVIRWLSFVGRDDGISNSTFDDMKEQICSRLGWRPGVMDVLFTDILANLSWNGETGEWTRGKLPSSKEDFLRILGNFSVRVNTKGNSRWWMDRIGARQDSPEYRVAVDAFGNGWDRITYNSVCSKMGIRRQGDGYVPTDAAKPLVREILKAGGDLAWIARAGSARGHNPYAGYLMYLVGLGEKLTDREVKGYVAFMKVYSRFRDMRDFVKSFNYTNVDVGNDTESGRRDRVKDAFTRFVYDKDGKVRAAAEGGRFANGYDILPALKKMNAVMRAAYDIGNELMTAAARGTLASERYERNFEILARDGGSDYAALLAKSLLLDPIDSRRTERMKLEANAQQVPYVLAGFEVFSRRVGESPIRNATTMYTALEGMAKGLTSVNDLKPIAAVRGIEALFEVMYRLAATSDEHRKSNNVFSYFRESGKNSAFAARGKSKVTEDGMRVRGALRYGEIGEKLAQIMPAFGANTEASVAEIRRKVDLVIQGKSFAGARTNSMLEPEYMGNYRGGSFALTHKLLLKMAEKTKDATFKDILTDAAKALYGMQTALGGKEIELTPAMMFGQLLPMYSVLTSRTLGAPSPASPSILNLLPDRYYRDLSAKQVENDEKNRGLVDLLVALNWAPRDLVLRAKYTEAYARKYGRATLYATAETLDKATREIIERAREAAGKELGAMKGKVEGLRTTARKGPKAIEARTYVDWRQNPDFQHLLDPFAASGLLMDALTALQRTPATARTVEATPVEALTGGAGKDTAPLAEKPMRPECVKFARCLGALAGSWAKVRYLGGDVFELRGNLKGDIAKVVDGKNVRTHKAVVLVRMGDAEFLNDEASVDALAMSYAYASSFCAVTDFRTDDGKPMTAERFMALPLEVRKALVRKYGIGAAASNRAVWSMDGKGVATLCGAISLANGKGGTKLYHEYFHAMMRFYDALGMFTNVDREELARFFNKDHSGTWTRNTEEIMAEGFRKWVERNTEPADTPDGRRVLSVFRRIMDFLRGLLKALSSAFTHGGALEDDPENPLIFRMAVHGIASSSAYRRELARQELENAGVNADDTAVAARLRAITSRVLHAGEQKAPETYTEDQVRDLMPGDPTDGEVAKVMEALAAKNTNRYADTKAKLDKAYNRRHWPNAALDELVGRLKDPKPSDKGLEIDLAIEEDYRNVTQEELDAASTLEAKTLDVLTAESSTTEDVREALGKLATARCALAEKTGYEFSPDTEASAQASEDPFAEVVPGSEDYTDAEIRTAAEAAAPLKGRYSEDAEKNLEQRLRSLVFSNIEAELAKDGRLEGQFAGVMRALGNPKPTEATSDRNSVIVGIRSALQALAPDAEVSKEKIEGSMAFEALLTMYQRLESSFRKKGDRTFYGEGAGRWKEYASAFDVAAWVLSDGRTTPGALVTQTLARIQEARNRYAEGTPGKAELGHLHDSFRELRILLSDSTGLLAYRRGQAADLVNTLFKRIRAGLMPADAEQGSDPASWTYFDTEGFQKDLKPIMPTEADDSVRRESEEAATHRYLLQGCVGDPAVQDALKLAIRTAYELAAMVKYQSELDYVPANAEDIAFKNEMLKRDYAAPVGEADWFASQSLSTSHLLDNRNLVEQYDQSYFIAANIDQWLSSQVRKTFGQAKVGDMMQAENREFGAIKSEILNLENYYSFLFGDNVEANGEILKLLEQDREFAMEFGTVVHGQFGKVLKFDNYRKVGSGVKLTQQDLVRIDLFKKMAKAHFQRQDRIVTGVDKLVFGSRMSTDPKDYSPEAIDEKERRARKERGEPLNPFEESLWRVKWQLPEEIGSRVYASLVTAATDAMREGQAILRSDRVPEGFDFNTHVLRALEAKGLCVAEFNGKTAHGNRPGLRRGAITLSVKDYHQFWLVSDTLKKLAKARRLDDETDDTEALKRLSLEAYERDMGAVWRKAAKFARAHAWLTEGDGRFMNMFGTCLPFFGGSGVFMYMANRRDRTEKRSYVRNLSKYEATFRNSVVGNKAQEGVENVDDDLMYFLHDMYETRETGAALRDAIVAGKYEAGPGNESGLVLAKDCVRGDICDAIYTRLLERADREEAGLPMKGDKRFDSADRILRAYEEARGAASDMFGGSTGLNDIQMFRLHGVLPSNDQLGHAVHKSIDGVTNAIMHRNTLANMLMTPNADGAPVYYADPNDLAVQASGLPDELWQSVARWWCDWNGFTYDESKSGVQNAKAVYRVIDTSRQQNKGVVTTQPAGAGDRDHHRYTEFPKSESDLASVDRWLVLDDEEAGDENSALNRMSGGEAMGYLRQFCQASRVLGFGGAKTRATLHRCLSWSKSMSVSFSFFFPLATKWESPIGAVGAMATIGSNMATAGRLMREHPEAFNAIQKVFGGRGWITKDFLGFTDVVRMMDSNDPFLAELISWAEALGVKISDRYVNPVEPTRGLVDADLNTLKRMVAENMGANAAARFGRATKFLFSRQSEKSFSYALNATKLATVAQLCMKLRAEAAKRGKAFDPVRDLRRYSGYINAEVGGIDPLKYAWATPRFRGFMNVLLFSWEWTRGAWEAGGGNVLEDIFLGGHNATPEERAFYRGRWARMFGEVMIGVPALIQLTAWALAKLASEGLRPDDDDLYSDFTDYAGDGNAIGIPWRALKWANANMWRKAMAGDSKARAKLLSYVNDSSPFTRDNERKTRWTAADLTPLLKVIGSANVGWLPGVDDGTTLADAKRRHPFALGWLPAYTGTDSANRKTANRRLYIHFGKQGWEEFRWFDKPIQQFFSKLSMPTQRILEGLFGRNLGYLDRALPWEDEGLLQRFTDPSFDGALWNIASAFLPFSVSGIVRTGDAGLLPIFGPTQYGASYSAVNDEIVDRLTAFANNDRRYYTRGYQHKGKIANWSRNMLQDILVDARANGVPDKDISTLIATAAGQVKGKLYGRLWELIPDDPKADFDAAEVNRVARSLLRVGATYDSMMDSLKKTLGGRSVDWTKDLTPMQREMYRTVLKGFKSNPYSDRWLEERANAVRESVQPVRFDY